LKELRIAGMEVIGKEDVLKVNTYLAQLELIDLSGCSYIDDSFIADLVKENPTLNSFILNDCSNLTDSIFSLLPPSLRVRWITTQHNST
jgi:hypothetical protein